MLYRSTIEKFIKSDRIVLKSGKPYFSEEKVKTVGGKEVTISVFKAPLFNERGQVEGLIGISHNINSLKQKIKHQADHLKRTKEMLKQKNKESRQAKQALLDSKFLLNKILEAEYHAIFIIDAKTTKIIDCNPSALKMFGYHRNEMFNKKVNFLHVNQLSLEKFRTELQAVVAEKGYMLLDWFEMKRKDGRIFPTGHRVFPLKNEHGEITKWVSIVRDKSLRKSRDSALKETENRYQMLVETMSDSLGIIDKNGKIRYVNDKAVQTIGYSREELIGQSPMKFLDKANQKIFKEQQKYRSKNERSSYELTWIRKDGKKVHTRLSPRDIYTDDNIYKGTFAIIVDITEIKKALNSLEKKEKELQKKTKYLKDANKALEILLKKREHDKEELADNILFNVKELIKPYLIKLKESSLNERQRGLLLLMESNLDDLISPFMQKLSVKHPNLSITEIKVLNLIELGKTTKEIAATFCISTNTVNFHRDNIRGKMGIKNKKVNLKSHLLSLE